MKKFVKFLFSLILMMTMYLPVHAQIIARAIPLWVSNKGYWVIENNKYSRAETIIRFYNNDHVLVHMEQVQNVKMNLKKPEVKIRLRKALELALQNWNNVWDNAYNSTATSEKILAILQ